MKIKKARVLKVKKTNVPYKLKRPISRSQLMEYMDEEEKSRVRRISKGFREGFKFIKNAPESITVFGSARISEDHPSYKLTRELGARIAGEGYAVVTGGAGGLMEAANRGAYEAGGESIGVNVILPTEQHINPYLTKNITLDYFFSRKVFLAFGTEAIIVAPGGFGTLDELFEVITLLQTNKIEPMPIILLGKDFWEEIFKLLEKKFLHEYKTISKEDLNLYTITDDIDEVINIIRKKEQSDLEETFS
ncbi:TIGR00730 family Rossman fold protein [Candidatus Saccharibacteria bacterium]|nr:TIGR00730 family Rossman fold protein [Candidatus Saccharibacteria bacterium]